MKLLICVLVSVVFTNAQRRIFGGEEVLKHSLPYQVVVSSGGSLCGGSLISRKYVLTAAHCVDNGHSAEITLGGHNIVTEERQAVRVKSVKIIIHPRWNSARIQNDVALIKLSHRVTLSNYIQLVKLPERSDIGDSFVDDTVIASGWGGYAPGSGISPVLKSVELAVVANSKCQMFPFVKETQICVQGPKGSACNGDSGGPLVTKYFNMQIGIVSYGSAEGCDKGYPNVFTRITTYMPWIAQNSDITY